MSAYRPTIGLEIHAELKTRTKMFCDCRNDPDEKEVNAHVCPICLAHPGTLPTANKEAVRHVLRVGTALGGTLADYTEFDRKSYFYPDIPKGYQISQYERPLVSGGELSGVQITRIHLEEDTARSMHADDSSLVDFNRAGVPLMELVTEPVIHDAKTAANFARDLQLLLRTLGASDANLEKGEMRVEANISVSKGEELGTKVEVKNLNSFRSVERAIAFEVERQIALLEKGEVVIQATRGWNEDKQQTFHQRSKEGSADYRYFPEPDLPKLKLSELSEFSSETLRASLPELPWERVARYEREFKLKSSDSAFIVSDLDRIVFADRVLGLAKNEREIELSVNYFVSDLAGTPGNVTPEAYVALMRLAASDALSSRGTKEVLAIMVVSGGDPEQIAKEKGLMQISSKEDLRSAIETVLKEHAAVVTQYKEGKESSLQFLVGQGMKATKGAGNPAVIKGLIEELCR
ncbi:Asp-tRNA(Asn)/Glu-tRNA(Gln) amidotransferase subunit GatB [Patescibacteria group bacterium]|nr:Asp-tRNA(Asn)/Glu-tRNA(Gln) amidotransferase subunit GatB [Patescibacteria group bacterium]